MGYVWLRPRPWPLYQDQNARSSFLKRLKQLVHEQNAEVWYQDECGVVGDATPRRVLAKKGTKPVVYYTGKHIRDNVIGCVRPADGKFFSLILPVVNKSTFQIFLDEAQQYIQCKTAYMILDNASWHKAKSLDWGKFQPIFLPPYSPDFNPIERVWLHMKENYFKSFVAENHDELTDRLMNTLRMYHNKQSLCKSLCGGERHNANSI